MLLLYRFIFFIIITIYSIVYEVNANAVDAFTIKKIYINGLDRIDVSTVLFYLSIKEGQKFTNELYINTIKNLYETGFFSDIKIFTENNIVKINLKERKIITNIEFFGLNEFNEDDMIKYLNVVGVSCGKYYNKSFINNVINGMKEKYLDHGFYSIKINLKNVFLDNNRVKIIFYISEGIKAKIKKIKFIGNKIFSEKILCKAMNLSEKNWYSWYTKSDILSEEKLLYDLNKLKLYYFNRGYLEANIESHQILISDDKKNLYLTIIIYEGERYKISDVILKCNLFKNIFRNYCSLVKSGDYFSIKKIEKINKLIIKKLGEYGYAFATVNISQDIEKQFNKVKIILKVNPKNRVYVRHINIFGNSHTQDNVIRREISQLEASIYNSKYIDLSRKKIIKLGYFSNVEFKIIPIDNIKDCVDINIQVTETRTGTALCGLGFSSSEKISLLAEISKSNIFGSGSDFSININTGYKNRTFIISHTNPYFTMHGIQRTIDIYYKTNNPLFYSESSNLNLRSLGANVGFGIPLFKSDNLNINIGYEKNKIKIDSYSLPYYADYVKKFGDVFHNAPLSISWSRDMRDNVLMPRLGYFVNTTFEYGASISGVQYHRTSFQAQYYYSLMNDVIFKLNFNGGYGCGINGIYPIFKNYYAGGIGSVRGYQENSLGPSVLHKGSTYSIGGSKILTSNIEISSPVPKIDNDKNIRFFMFFDTGNVWGGYKSKNNKKFLRCSYGVGFSWQSPFAPFKFSIGFPLMKYHGDQYEKFQFQIGAQI